MEAVSRLAKRFLEVTGLRTRNVMDDLNDERHLFRTTAYKHGTSESTTTNKKRLTVDTVGLEAKRRRGNTGASLSVEDEEEDDGEEGKPDMSKQWFHIRVWEGEDFFEFLRSADAEIDMLRERKTLPLWSKRTFDENIAYNRGSEATIQHDITQRMEGITTYLDHEYLEQEKIVWHDGMSKNTIFPGRDNQIDHSVQRNVKQINEDMLYPPAIGVEDKVSWNYPGGVVTSGDVDPGRLGRDVSLVDLVSGNEIDSAADYKESEDTKRNDDKLDVAEGQADDNSRRPTVAMGTSSRNKVQRKPTVAMGASSRNKGQRKPTVATRKTSRTKGQPKPNYTNSPPKVPKKKVGNGKYVMKHDVFPPRQLVSSMLSAGMPYAYLTTGYRIDFCKLEVSGTKVTLHIAGPFWTVGELHREVAEYLRNPAQTRGFDREKMKTSDIYCSEYYGKVGVRKFGQNRPMSFFRRDATDVGPECDLQEWSTDIGDYTCLEGLLRFILAGTATDTDNDGTKKARHSLRLPTWYANYATAKFLKSPGNAFGKEGVASLQEGADTHSSSIAPTEHNLAFSSGLTKFGPLCLADLHDPVRYKENIQYPGRLEEDAKLVGFGRNGPAFRKSVRNVDLVCKQVAGVGCVLDDDDMERRILNLKHEMRCYGRMAKLQGEVIPEFLFAGKLVDTRYWVCPERGHVYGLATTWAGYSLDTKAGADMVRKMLAGTSTHECDIRTDLLELLEVLLRNIHDCGILHNDLELRNIVCDGRKLAFIDFDAAVIVEDRARNEQEAKAEIRQLVLLMNEFCRRG